MISIFNYNNSNEYTYDVSKNPILEFAKEEIPDPQAGGFELAPLSIDSATLDDVKPIIAKHSDLTEKNRWLRVSKSWNGFVETENQWSKVAKRLHIPSVSEEKQVKEQVKDFIRISNHNGRTHLRGSVFTVSMEKEINVLVESLRMRDINTLRRVREAKDTLSVWQALQERIPNPNAHPNLNINQFDSVKELIEMAGKFKQWCKDNAVELSKLQDLDIRKKRLMFLPTKIWKFLPNLTALNLSDNLLTSISIEILKLANLRNLDMNDNCLDSLPEKISELKNLNTLILSKNRISSLPDEILKLVNLQNLDLRNNSLIISVPDGFWHSPLFAVTSGVDVLTNIGERVADGVMLVSIVGCTALAVKSLWILSYG